MNIFLLQNYSYSQGIIRALGYGYTAVVKGDVAHIFGCQEVEVTYRHMNMDAQFLPVFYKVKEK